MTALSALNRETRSLPVGFRRLAVIGVTVIVLVSVYQGTQGSSGLAQSLGDVSILVFCLLAAVACTRAAARRTPASRGWALLAVSTFLWAAGQLLWTVYGVTLDHVYPFPSIADAAFLGYAIPAIAALLAFPSPRTQLATRLRVILDSLVILLGVLAVSQATVLQSVHGGLDTLAGLTGLAYPVVDVAICSLVLTLGMRQPAGERLSWLFLGGGLVTLALTDSFYVRLTLEGQTALTATPLVAGWMTAFLLVALATLVPSHGRPAGRDRGYRFALELIPYVPVLGAVVAFGFATVDRSPVLIGTGIALLVCVTVRQIMIVFENVTLTRELERKVAERTAELNSLASIVTSSTDAIVGVSLDGVITSWNPAAERLYLHRAIDTVGRPPAFLTPSQRRFLDKMLDTARRGGPLRGFETMWPRPDQSVVPVSVSVSPILDGDRVRGISIFGRDNTERHSIATALNNAREEALESSRLKSEFLATMSHEIRTPMNGVIGLTSLMLETPLSEVQRQYAEGVHGAGEALLNVINDILDFSKLEAGKVELELADFDPRRLVEEVGALLAPTAHAKNLELLAYCLPDVPAMLRGDAGRIRQVLLNLASNAVKFTEQGEVAIRVRCTQSTDAGVTVRFDVTDTGMGIATKDQDRLFESFSQADASTTRRFGGTGLGLAISRRLVEVMDGRIAVTSEPGAGSTFWFDLPLAVGTRTVPLPLSRDLLTGLRALVVDDNATNRLILQTQLSAWELRPDLAIDSQSALTRLRRMKAEGRPYDIAVLDMCMPDMDGLQLAEAISADPELRGIRMIMLTSAIPVSQEQLRQAGIGESLTKPVRSSELFDRLMRLMAPDVSAIAAPSLIPAAPLAGEGSRGRILVVEDNALNQLVADGVVTRLGYHVDIVSNGAEALDAVARTEYSAVLMDCHMPVLDGFEATTRIRRREPAGTRLPIIAMTAGAMAEDRERCLAAGMDDYVSKPIDVETVARVLREWARAVPTADDAARPGSAAAEPAIDPRRVEVLRGLGGPGSGLLEAIAAAFSRDGAGCLIALSEAAGGLDGVGLRRAAHELKGASANVGAARVAALCHELETGPHPDGELTEDLLGQLHREFDRANRELRGTVSAGTS